MVEAYIAEFFEIKAMQNNETGEVHVVFNQKK